MAAMMSVRWKPRTSGRGGCPQDLAVYEPAAIPAQTPCSAIHLLMNVGDVPGKDVLKALAFYDVLPDDVVAHKP